MALKLVGGFTGKLRVRGSREYIPRRVVDRVIVSDPNIAPPPRRALRWRSRSGEPGMSADPDLIALDELPDDARELDRPHGAGDCR